jgi:hypothetical protein
MRGVDGISEDALARMEGVGAFGSPGLVGFAARAWFGLRSFHFNQRKIGDGAGPGEFGVVEGGEVGCGGGEARGRHHYKNDMPQGSSDQGAAGNFALDPTLLEEAAIQKVLGDTGPGQDGYDAAADSLVEGAPSDVELGALACFEAHGNGRRCGLSQ